MKIRGILVDALLEIAREVRNYFISYDGNNNKILHTRMFMPLCSMEKAAEEHCNQFVKEINEVGCALNLRECCVSNKVIEND